MYTVATEFNRLFNGQRLPTEHVRSSSFGALQVVELEGSFQATLNGDAAALDRYIADSCPRKAAFIRAPKNAAQLTIRRSRTYNDGGC